MKQTLKFLAGALAIAALTTSVTMFVTPNSVSAQDNILKVLIVGDSFSAGNGAGSYYGTHDCHRSGEVWGEKVASSLGTDLDRTVEVTNRACRGAVTKDVVGGTVDSPRAVDRDLRTKTFESKSFWNSGGQESADSEASQFCEGLGESADGSWTGHANHKTWNFYSPKCTQYIKSQIDYVYGFLARQ